MVLRCVYHEKSLRGRTCRMFFLDRSSGNMNGTPVVNGGSFFMEMGVVSIFFKLNISGQPVGAVGYAYPYSQDGSY